MTPSRLLLAGALLTAAAGRLAAQTQPMPTLPSPAPVSPGSPDVPGAAAPSPDEAPAGPRRSMWDYALSVGGRWDENIEFILPDGAGGFAVVPRGSLARLFVGPRGRMRASASGWWIGYVDDEDPRRGYGDFALDGEYQTSRSTRWRINAVYSLGHSDTARTLQDQGVALPLVETQTFTGSLGLVQQIGTRTSLQVEGRYYQTGFDSPVLVDGQSVRGTIGIDQKMGERTSGALVYSIEDVLADTAGGSYLNHYASLRLQRVLSPRTSLLLEGGASFTPSADRAALEQSESFYGGVSLIRQVKQSSFTLYLRREVVPAFGTGVSRLESRAGLAASIPVGKSFTLRFDGSAVRPDTPPNEVGGTYPSRYDGYVVAEQLLGRHVALSAEGSYRRRGATTSLPSVEAFHAGLYLTLFRPGGSARDNFSGR